jgi:SAM-dependent methyltransferase
MNPTLDTTIDDDVDPATLGQEIEQFAGRVVTDLAAAWTVVSVHIGDRLGLYRVLAEGDGTASEIAHRAGCHERLVREWLDGQVAAGIVDCTDGDSPRYRLPDAHAAVLAADSSPAFLGSAGGVLAAVVHAEDRIVDAFRSDGVLPWSGQHSCLFPAVDRFFATGYRSFLVGDWIPALERADLDLRNGGRVADVGCGWGTPLALLAEAYPDASFVGIDCHDESLDRAAERLAAAGVGDRVRFERADAVGYGGGPFDLICFFDALHDMGDPAAAVAHARTRLAPTGSVLLVEPQTEETLAQRVGSLPAQLYYPGSAFLCTPNAIAQGGHGLGNQVPEQVWRDVFARAGFGTFRRVRDTPVNRVFEARIQP